jgi:ADP-ribose pyrophosphatase YjhB (NUDIX family)
MLTAEEEAEIGGLARRVGVPRRWRREYETTSEQAGWVKKMLKRRGEVILVVPTAEGRIWLHTKQFYPPGVYRLPSGGIHQRESVEEAASRELYEEMGFKPELARFLGVVENVFKFDRETLVYPSYILETRSITDPPSVSDPDEAISGFREIDIRELGKIVEQLDSLASAWQPWGHFRAAPHALVAEAMASNE